MAVSIRRIALAGLAGITIAIVIDGLLQLALEAVRTDARRMIPNSRTVPLTCNL
jgi:hypothetical protein